MITTTYLEDLEKELPQFLTAKDLVDLKLWPNTDAVYLARLYKKAPLAVLLGRKVLFPKRNVIEFLKQRTEQELQEVQHA